MPIQEQAFVYCSISKCLQVDSCFHNLTSVPFNNAISNDKTIFQVRAPIVVLLILFGGVHVFVSIRSLVVLFNKTVCLFVVLIDHLLQELSLSFLKLLFAEVHFLFNNLFM